MKILLPLISMYENVYVMPCQHLTCLQIVDPTNPEKINYFRFVRALRISEPANDVNLFFDERERQINLLKSRVRTLEKEASNPDLFQRKQYLENELGIGLTGLQRYLAPLDTTLQTSQSMPTLTTLTIASEDTSDQRPMSAASPDPAARTLTPIHVDTTEKPTNKRPHRNSTKQIGGASLSYCHIILTLIH